MARLERVREGKWIAGVCAGLAAHLGLDPTLVRLVFVIGLIMGGPGLLFYLIFWLIIPEQRRS